ncbi:hypothetical protein ES707_16919 [subsurface metagenome]
MVAYGAGLDPAGPADNHRDTKTALVQIPFLSSKVPVGIEEIIESPPAAVIAADEDNRIVFNFELFKQSENLPDLPVNHFHHCGVNFDIVRPLLARAPGFVFEIKPGGLIFRNSPPAVRRRPRAVAEKRLVPMLANKLYGLVEDQVMRELLSLVVVAGVAFEGDFLAGANEVVGEERVGVCLVVVAIENIESMPLRGAGGSAVAAAPLAESAGCVACPLEHFRDCHILIPKRYSPVISTQRVGAHTGPPARACVKRIPSAAILSMFGVSRCLLPMQDNSK